MKIGGLQKLSLIDYPGRLSAVIFTTGCNFRCAFCHNPSLVVPEKYAEDIDEEAVIQFLEERKKYLGGVVITGGEPTIHSDLPLFIEKIKKMGYSVKLDTNGTNPEMIESLINKRLIDYIAMDIKATLKKYSSITCVNLDTEKIIKSIKLIKDSKISHEFRTTVAPGITYEDIVEVCELVGSSNYYLQPFESYRKELVGTNLQAGEAKDKLKEWCMKISEKGKKCILRYD